MSRIIPSRPWTTSKLDDCAGHGPGSGAELFIVEGDSAAASVGRVRDACMQAVLPMQGKPLNTTRASRRKVVEHPFFGPLTEDGTRRFQANVPSAETSTLTFPGWNS